MTRFGQGAFVSLGVVESHTATGTAGAQKLYFQVTEDFDGLQLERTLIEFPDLTSETPYLGLLKAGQRRVTGTLKLKATYDGVHDLLRLITGHNATGSGSGPYTYSFTPVSRASTSHHTLGSTPRAIQIEVFRGGSYANSTFYQGCHIQKAEFDFQKESHVTVTLTFIGRGYLIAAKTTPTYLSDFIVTTTGQDSATPFLDLAGTPYRTHAAKVTIDNAIDFNHDMTSIETALPQPSGRVMCTIEAEVEADDDTLLNYINDPEGTAFSGNFLRLTTGTGASLRLLEFQFDRLVLRAPAEPRAASLGQVRAKLNLEAKAGTAGQVWAYKATVKNGVSAYKTFPIAP